MKIESVKIENFRCFKDETILFNDYTCMVGANGAGKSTVLCALNVFFRQHRDSKTDLSKLSADDFHHKNTNKPIRITVTFKDLSEEAKKDLSNYVRQDRLIVTSVAQYDEKSGLAEVKQYGSRLGMKSFIEFFAADKGGSNAAELKDIYNKFKEAYPDLPSWKSKPDAIKALNDFEASHASSCEPIESEDQFYGATKGTNRLSPHVQWIFVSAAKDITEESQESKTSSLGQLLARTIRSKVNFSEKVAKLRTDLQQGYQSILDAEQSVLDSLSDALQLRLRDWAHPNATAKILWRQDPDKSVKVEEPWAYVRLGERGFEGELARFGHGMQRSYMLTLLQELASTDDKGAPTLIMAIEEPELYQHPPQARYLAEVFHDLSSKSAQILVCSHSPLFIPGDDFESVRVIRENGSPSESTVEHVKYADLAKEMTAAGQKALKETGMLAKLYPALNPLINEMFFCKVLVLTEGIEDVAYLSAYLMLSGKIVDFRRNGCHIVPAGRKSDIIKPLCIAKLLKIPTFVVADADTYETQQDKIDQHKRDNKNILIALSHSDSSEWPNETIRKDNLTLWKTNISKTVLPEIGDKWKGHYDEACAHYGNAGSLEKNPLVISRALESAWNQNLQSESLLRVVDDMIKFAKSG